MNRETFVREIRENLTDNILSYWMDKMVDPRGGFYGRRDGYDRLHADALKGAILNGRILWSFSSAYRITGDSSYAEMALRARDYIAAHFVDTGFGGVYWSVDADGNPLDTKKQYYAIAFVIYGLAEHFRATGDRQSLELAKELFESIECHSVDALKGGYVEASKRDWSPIEDMRLSDKDANASKTMNTHLHILEAYTALLRVWDHEPLREAQRRLVCIFLDRILDRESCRLGLFFDDDWNRLDGEISYGHDIEASWLLYEAAEVVGDADLLDRVKSVTEKIALASLDGLQDDGSMIYEKLADGTLDMERHWWAQSETVVGLMYLWKFHGKEEMLGIAMRTWEYIRDNLVDRKDGEWYWSILPDGTIDRKDDHAGFWKCPYHNSRMAMETITLLAD